MTQAATASTPGPAARGPVHLPALDGLRGLAIALVLFFHFTRHSPLKVIRTGWAGVDLFFVLSGFLITGILYDARSRPHYFRNFFARRALRIFPLYYLFLIVCFFVLPSLIAAPVPTLGERAPKAVPLPPPFYFWGYLTNVAIARFGWTARAALDPLWSLSVEEQFYFIWPLFVRWLPLRRLLQVCGLFVALAITTRIGLMLLHAPRPAPYVLLPARMDALAIGGAVALLLRGPVQLSALATIARRVAWVIGVGLVVLIVVDVTRQAGLWNEYGPFMQSIGYTLLALLAASALVLTLEGRSAGWNRLMTSSPMRTLGLFSYSLYLCHMPVRVAMYSLLEPRLTGAALEVGVAAASLCILLPMSWLLWRLFESPILSLRRYVQ